MAMKCSKCDGIIPDILFGIGRNDCRNHIKTDNTFNFEEYRKHRIDSS